jgi:hypothetical protein
LDTASNSIQVLVGLAHKAITNASPITKQETFQALSDPRLRPREIWSSQGLKLRREWMEGESVHKSGCGSSVAGEAFTDTVGLVLRRQPVFGQPPVDLLNIRTREGPTPDPQGHKRSDIVIAGLGVAKPGFQEILFRFQQGYNR